MKVKHEHAVAAPVDKVMALYRDKDFYIAKLKNSGALTVDVLLREDLPAGGLHERARVSEPSRVPAFLRKNDVDTYEDDHTLDAVARTLTWKVTPAIMADKFFLSGRTTFNPDGHGTRMVFETEMVVKIPLVGGKAESIGLAKTDEEVARQVAFVKRWLAEHP